jgi:hypothetical protein
MKRVLVVGDEEETGLIVKSGFSEGTLIKTKILLIWIPL